MKHIIAARIRIAIPVKNVPSIVLVTHNLRIKCFFFVCLFVVFLLLFGGGGIFHLFWGYKLSCVLRCLITILKSFATTAYRRPKGL